MGMTIRELVTRWGFDVDKRPLDQIERSQKTINSLVRQFTVVSGLAGIAIGKFLKEAGEMEQVEIAFETMLKSGKKAQQLIQDITDFAAKTPFELTGLIKSSKQLLAFKFQQDEIIDTMRNLGNIAAGVGREKLPTLIRAYGKIRVKGKATMEELNMLLEAGVPILDQLAENLGVTTERLFKMITAGEVGFDAVRKALTDMSTGTGQFAGLMQKQSKAFLGIWSNIRDVIDQITIAVGKDLLPEAKVALKTILGFLEANKDLIKVKIVKFLKTIAGALKEIFMFLYNIRGLLKALIAAFVVFKGLQLVSAIGNLAIGFFELAKGIRLAGKAALIANIKMASLALLIGSLVILIGLIAQDIIFFFQGKKSLFGRILEAAEVFFKRLQSIIDRRIERIKKSISELFDPIRQLQSRFGKFFGTAAGGPGTLFKGAAPAIFSPFGGLTSPFAPQRQPAGPPPDPRAATVPVNIEQNITITNPTDPEGVKKIVTDGISEAMTDAAQQVFGGGKEAKSK